MKTSVDQVVGRGCRGYSRAENHGQAGQRSRSVLVQCLRSSVR